MDTDARQRRRRSSLLGLLGKSVTSLSEDSGNTGSGSNSNSNEGQIRWFEKQRRRASAIANPLGFNSGDGRTAFEHLMARLAKAPDAPVEDKAAKPASSFWNALCVYASIRRRSFIRTCTTAFSDSKIIAVTLLTFAVVCGAGLAVVLVFSEGQREVLYNEAESKAKEMGHRVTHELKRAVLPLFTMAEVVKQLDTFYDVPLKTATAPQYLRSNRAFRNTTGICDDPLYTVPYNELAASIKKSAKMKRILVNIQLAPFGVVCLLHPLINTEDFDEGVVMDNSGAVGLDLLNDGFHGYYARESIREQRVTITGPLKLIQGNTSVVKEALIARNPIYVDGHNLTIDGVEHSFWGFATVLLNWAQLKKRLGLLEYFHDNGLDFRMTRTDVLMNFTSNEEYKRIVVIAESEGAADLNEEESVFVPLHTTDNEWVLMVGCPKIQTPWWKSWACVAVVVGAFLVSTVLMVVLVAKKEHEVLLYRMMPKEVIHRLQRGETVIEKYDLATICIIDIVSFTTISGKMKAIEVMRMLKELYTEFDKLAAKHHVHNVETIGDAYIVIGGGPEKCYGREGAEKVALFAFHAIEAVRNLQFTDGSRISIRAGLASGLVVAGVVGTTMPKYTLFGETVTLASKLESSSTAMKVQCSDLTYRLLRDARIHQFDLEERRDDNNRGTLLSHNGRGLPRTWWIKGVRKRDLKGSDPVFPINTSFSNSRKEKSIRRGEHLAELERVGSSERIVDTENERGANSLASVGLEMYRRATYHSEDVEIQCPDISSADEQHYAASKSDKQDVCQNQKQEKNFVTGASPEIERITALVGDTSNPPGVGDNVVHTQWTARTSLNGVDDFGEQEMNCLGPELLRRASLPASIAIDETKSYESMELSMAMDKCDVAAQNITQSCDGDKHSFYSVAQAVNINHLHVKSKGHLGSEEEIKASSATVPSNERGENLSRASSCCSLPKAHSKSSEDDRYSDANSCLAMGDEDSSYTTPIDNLADGISRKTMLMQSKRASFSNSIEVSSIFSKESSAFHTYWSRLAKANDAWKREDADEQTTLTTNSHWGSSLLSSLSVRLRSLQRIGKTAVTQRAILFSILTTFTALCTAGLAIVIVLANSYENNLRNEAVIKAKDADRLLSSDLDEALIPLFAMSELVKKLDVFKDMPSKIEKTTKISQSGRAYRIVTGICDDPSYVTAYNNVAAPIKNSSGLEETLFNVQIAPYGVACLFYPLVNKQDFPGNVSLDSRKAIGHDILNDRVAGHYARKAIKENRYTVQGPLELIQGKKPVMSEALLVRNPVPMDGYNLNVEGKDYSVWGLTIVLLNWVKLKEESEFYNVFARSDMDFIMTRTDTLLNLTTQEEYEREAVIAESRHPLLLHELNSVTVPLETTDNTWILKVGYQKGFSPPWKIWGCVCVIMGAFLVSLVLMFVLVATKEHEQLLYRMMPKDVIRRLQRGETVVERNSLATIFFSHIIGFTTLSGQMRPTEFMIMLNQIYEEFDKLVLKHKVYKVETIGDAYIVTGTGSDECSGKEGAVRVALFALDALLFVRNFRYKGMRVFIRAGLASGPVVSGVIGAALPKYTIFGDTVNFASRMESTSKSMKIQCSERTHELLEASTEYGFETEERREGSEAGISVKGKGWVHTWWIKDVRNKLGKQIKRSSSELGAHSSNVVKNMLFRRSSSDVGKWDGSRHGSLRVSFGDGVNRRGNNLRSFNGGDQINGGNAFDMSTINRRVSFREREMELDDENAS